MEPLHWYVESSDWLCSLGECGIAAAVMDLGWRLTCVPQRAMCFSPFQNPESLWDHKAYVVQDCLIRSVSHAGMLSPRLSSICFLFLGRNRYRDSNGCRAIHCIRKCNAPNLWKTRSGTKSARTEFCLFHQPRLT